MIKEATGYLVAALLMYSVVYTLLAITASEHRQAEIKACHLANGRGTITYSFGIPVSYECMRMHLVLKYKNGVYK